MLDKIMTENNINLEIAIAWFVNAKTSLQNISGLPLHRVATGENLQLLSVLNDNLNTLSSRPTYFKLKKFLWQVQTLIKYATYYLSMSEHPEILHTLLVTTYTTNVL